MGTLLALNRLRQKRYDDAQTRVYSAHRTVVEKQQSVADAKEALETYVKRLPQLIEALYRPILGTKSDVGTVQEKLGEEIRLTQKKTEFEEKVTQSEKAVQEAQSALAEAKAYLMQCEKKNLAIQELVGLEERAERRQEERLLGKAIDELSTHQYIVKTVSQGGAHHANHHHSDG